MRRIEKEEWIPDVERPETPAVDGQDVQISIDIDMQDIAQKALLNKIKDEDLSVEDYVRMALSSMM